MSGHRILISGRVDYPDGSQRIMFHCAAGMLLGGLLEVGQE